MALWSLILAFVGGLRLIETNDGRASVLLAGSGLMAVVSLAFWVGIIGRVDRGRVLIKIGQVAGAIVGFGTLAWAIVQNDKRRNVFYVSIAALGLSLSWIAWRYERRKIVPGEEPKTNVL